MTVADAPRPAFTLPIDPDPLPWLTERFRAAGVFEVEDPIASMDPVMLDVLKDFSGGKTPRVKFDRNVPTLKAMSAALGITSSIVTALSSSEQRFSVRFHPTASTAYSALKTREVVIGIRPMVDPRLTEGQRAALMVALAYHEVGHIIWTAGMRAKVEARYGAENKPAMKVFNVVHDLLLEAQQAITYPGYAPTLLVKRAYWGKEWNARLNSKRNRYGSLVQATLYPQGTDWRTPELVDWFTWADDWAKRCRDIRAGKSPKYLLDLIDEGLAALRLDEPDEVDPRDEEEEEERPTQPPIEEGEEDEEGDDGWDDEDGDPDGDMEDPFGDDEDQPTGRPQPQEEDEWPDLDEEPDGDLEDEPVDDPTEDQPVDEPPTTEGGEGVPTDEEDESEEDEGDEKGNQGGSQDDDSDEEEKPEDQPDEDGGSGGKPGDDDESNPDPAEDGTEFDKPRDEFDDPRIPQPHVEDDEDTESWQGRIDDYDRVQVTGRDKVYVGGGSFHKREVRILRQRS